MASFSHDNPKLAEAYDRLSDTQFEGGKRLVERLAIAPGERVLDVGCGTGRLARWIAERVGPTGAVVGIDPLIDRILLARSRSPDISFEVGQAEDLRGFADESFDVVCMSAVFHWVTDKAKALSEIHRVLRPGGKLGLTTLPKELQGAGTTAWVLGQVFAQPAYKDSAAHASMARAHQGLTLTELVEALLKAKLELVEVFAGQAIRHHANATDLVDFMEASSFGNLLGGVPAELRPRLRAELVEAFDARRGPEGIAMTQYVALAVARRG